MRPRRITLSGPVVEIDGRASVTSDPSTLNPIVDPRDEPQPNALTEPEREDIYRRMFEQDQRVWTLEKRIDELEKSRSLPVTLSGPRGFAITGSWRFMILLALIIAVVTLAYFGLQYTQKQKRTVTWTPSISLRYLESTSPTLPSQTSYYSLWYYAAFSPM